MPRHTQQQHDAEYGTVHLSSPSPVMDGTAALTREGIPRELYDKPYHGSRCPEARHCTPVYSRGPVGHNGIPLPDCLPDTLCHLEPTCDDEALRNPARTSLAHHCRDPPVQPAWPGSCRRGAGAVGPPAPHRSGIVDLGTADQRPLRVPHRLQARPTAAGGQRSDHGGQRLRVVCEQRISRIRCGCRQFGLEFIGALGHHIAVGSGA